MTGSPQGTRSFLFNSRNSVYAQPVPLTKHCLCPRFSRFHRFGAATFTSIVLCGILHAQNSANAPVADQVDSVSRGRVDDIDTSFARQLELTRSWKDTPIGRAFQPWRAWREGFQKKIGLEIQVDYDVLFQGYLSDGASISGSAGEFKVDGRWLLFGTRFGVPSYLGFRVRHRHGLEDRTPADIGPYIGAHWSTIRGFTNKGLEIPSFFIEHEFLDGTLDFRWGQMNFTSLFDGNSLRSAKQSFGNRAFSGSPAIDLPRFGAGLYLRWLAPHNIEISAGATNVMSTNDADSVSFDFNSAELFEAIQFAWNFKGYRQEKARIQAVFWHVDPVAEEERPEGQGLSLTYEQAFCNERFIAFARLGIENGGSTPVDRMISLGGALKQRHADYLGIAITSGKQSGTNYRQQVLECYYRWQFGPEIQISPSVQILHGKGFYDGNGPHFIFGLRAQIAF